MQRAIFFLTAAAVLSAAPAVAGITAVTTETSATTKLRSQLPVGPVVNGPASLYLNDSRGNGTGYSAFTETDPNFIYFESGSMTAGAGNGSSATTQVNIALTADAETGSIDRLVSTVFGSTFGFYVAAFGEGDPVCAGITLPSCGVVSDGAGFGQLFNQVTVGASIATTRIAFDVLVDGNVVRSIGGSLTMIAAANGQVSFVENLGSGEDALDQVLRNFRFDGIDNYAWGYTWDDTDFTALFGDTITPGESALVSYRITTSTSSLADARIATNRAVVSYACFPDPVGRGGGNVSSETSTNLRSAFAAMTFAGNEDDDTCDDFTNPETRKYALELPSIRDGAIVFGAPAVPEPATWAMLIAGFGLVGGALRRERRLRLAPVRA
jgi:hypothetical protein